MMLNQLALIFPELLLTSLVLVMQTLAVFFRAQDRNILLSTVIISLFIAYFTAYSFPQSGLVFSESFFASPTISTFKGLVLVFAATSILIYHEFTKLSVEPVRNEFATLILLSTLGMFITISARDFLLLFCGMELQSLAGYALAAFSTNKAKSSEGGLKYFILGSLVSCIMLFGISLLYGFSGSIKFVDIAGVLNRETNIAMIIGIIFVLAAILFKLSAAPLHIWTPDVYEGSPISVVAFFATSQKIGMLIVLMNMINLVIGEHTEISINLIKIVAIFSMIIGSLGAIRQSSLKRLMAYSTILNIGYVLIGISLHSPVGQYAAILYLLIYVVGTMAFFACLISFLGKKSDEATFDDLKGLGKTRKATAACMVVIMFSMIGIPPFAGFFGKYYLFYNAIKHQEYGLAIIGVVTSVIAAYYYLKVIKYLYFVENIEKTDEIIPSSRGLLLISSITVAITLFFFAVASSFIL